MIKYDWYETISCFSGVHRQKREGLSIVVSSDQAISVISEILSIECARKRCQMCIFVKSVKLVKLTTKLNKFVKLRYLSYLSNLSNVSYICHVRQICQYCQILQYYVKLVTGSGVFQLPNRQNYANCELPSQFE